MNNPDSLPWADSSLFPKSESPRRHEYRRLQSWYRSEVLHAPYGSVSGTKNKITRVDPIGSLFHSSAVKIDPTLNFLAPSLFAPEILEYVNDRIPQVRTWGGALDSNRLRHNMLSSMPLCFNLFAPLRSRREIAASVFSKAFDLDVAHIAKLEKSDGVQAIDGIECEWSPRRDLAMNDGTAFDAVVYFMDSKDQRCLLGIETKYTEPFSTTAYGKPGDTSQAARRAAYVKASQTGWFKPGAADRLWQSPTNQLWRNVMLAASCEASDELPHIDRAYVGVIHLDGDGHADRAIEGVSAELNDPMRLKHINLQDLMRAIGDAGLPELSEAFVRRYLDLSPVMA